MSLSRWVATTKNIMISRNNLVGDPSMRATIGIGHEVSGIRAQIVTYLSKLRDYYVREGL